MPPRLAWLMEAAADMLGFVVCLVMMRYGLKMTVDSAVLGSITIKNLVFPEWWLLGRCRSALRCSPPNSCSASTG